MKFIAVLLFIVIAFLGVSSKRAHKPRECKWELIQFQQFHPNLFTDVCIPPKNQPRQRFQCLALKKRFRYNAQTKKCELFIYGGCGGDNNNFNSKEHCEEFCKNAWTVISIE